jgi:hypothetical protein
VGRRGRHPDAEDADPAAAHDTGRLEDAFIDFSNCR